MSRAVQRRFRERRRRDAQSVQAIAIVFAGSLLAIALPAALDSGPLATDLLGYGLMIAAGVAGVVRLDFSWSETFADWPPAVGWALGVCAALAMLLVSLLYGFALGGSWSGWTAPGLFVIVSLVLLPAFVEEWLCRGVLWAAARRLVDERQTIVITAVLFGLLHILAWGPFGFPNRAAGGIVLGIVRMRTGSLAPCVLAHLINNYVAAGLEGAG